VVEGAVALYAIMQLVAVRKRAKHGLPNIPMGVILARIAGLAILGGVVVYVANQNRGVPYVGVLMLVLLIGWTFVAKRTRFGRHVYAVGGNATAARLSGVNVSRVRVAVFVLSGLFAALAALLHAALVNQGSHIDGNGYELNAIAAVVIGGTSLAGGVGTVVGSMIGALTLSVLDNILGLRNIESEYQAILKGVIIVLAVFVQRQTNRGAARAEVA